MLALDRLDLFAGVGILWTAVSTLNPTQSFTVAGVMNYARKQIQHMQGYTPGEQPRSHDIIKLNTNENPYPPSPAVGRALAEFNLEKLRRYPDPVATELRAIAAQLNGLPGPEWVLAGNGSDDLLTMALRTFADSQTAVAYPWPTYSLYPVLCEIQGTKKIEIQLDTEFNLPDDFTKKAKDANLIFIARPNAPTGNAFPMNEIRDVCGEFDGIVWIDEAYADFADDNCMELVTEFDNIVVSRTLSKSASLAGLRLGLAFANPAIVDEMMKVKDSYNVSMLTQELAKASLRDTEYTANVVREVQKTRSVTTDALVRMGFEVLPSQANFVFVKPPKTASAYVEHLRLYNVLVRYFPEPRTRDFVRITIGTPEQMRRLLEATEDFVD
jgi:histidinol-phosphate aminotransferase